METKIKNFLQSDFFILSISLLLGLLCHFFVATEIVGHNKKVKTTKNPYVSLLESNLDIALIKKNSKEN